MKKAQSYMIKKFIFETFLFIIFITVYFISALLYVNVKPVGEIKKISLDSNGNIFIMTDTGGWYEFIKFNKEKEAEFCVAYPKYDFLNNKTYKYPNIIIADGEAYVHREAYDESKRIVSESIVKISGSRREVIYSIDNIISNENTFLYNNLTFANGNLYILKNEMFNIKVIVYDGETLYELESFVIDDYIDYAEIFYTKDNYIIYSDYMSNIKRQTVYTELWDEIIICAGATQGIFYNGENELAYVDLYTDNLTVMDFFGGIKVNGFIKGEISSELAFCGESLALITRDESRIMFYESYKDLSRPVSITPKPGFTAYKNSILIYAVAASVIYIMIRFYILFLFEKHTSVSLKLVLAGIPFVAAGIIGVYFYFSISIAKETVKQKHEQLLIIAELIEERLDTGIVSKIDLDVLNQEYYNVVETALGIVYDSFYEKYGSKDMAKREIYAELLIVKDGKFYIYYAKTFKIGSNIKYFNNTADTEKYEMLKYSGRMQEINTKSDGNWNYYLRPVLDEEGNLTAVLEVGMDMEMADNYAKSLAMTLSAMIAVFGVFITAVFSIVINAGLKSLRALKKGVRRITDGESKVKIKVGTKDEIGSITQAFNVMSDQISYQMSELTLLNDSYYRFVPVNLLSMLNKKSITEIRLGNHSEILLTLMHVNMRGFFSIASGFSNKDILGFLNSYFNRTVKVIKKNGGYVQSYDNAAIEGVFEESSENALTAALQLQESIRVYNKEKIGYGKVPIYAGIALNRAEIIVGVIGEETSLKVSLISKHVRILTALEKASEDLGVNILLTGWVFKEIENVEKYHYRYLGKLLSAEFGEPIDIYDFYDTDLNKNLKLASSEKFKNGVRLFYMSEFYEARKNFISVLMDFPEDKTSGIYLSKCDSFISGGGEELGLVVLG